MSDQDHLYDVAIVGLAGRFPKARDVGEYWRNLKDGVESLCPLSDEELEDSGVPRAQRDDPAYVKAALYLDDIATFDAELFDLTPREAEVLDPQHRLFLECCWHALEDAGRDPATSPGAIGVYGGTFMSTYLISNLLTNRQLLPALGETVVRHGNEKDYLATRVSYKLNLRGPSLTVQTSCSTSLVATHLACQALLNRECDTALAGGVMLRVPAKVGYLYQAGGILSPDGRCRAFDARADGTVFGPGVGTVVLRRLADALEDGDRIYAVIKGSAINNDGSGKIGYTAPSVEGQAEVIAEALAMAGVDPETISYVEAHGTATALGDPIEIAALTRVYREHTAARQFCAIGSVKTNIGHLGAASGIAGLIKTALMLYHRWLPPSLHFTEPNPEIDFASSPFYVNTASRPWENGGGPRRAGVSSFGMGGTNSHAILEEAPPRPPSGAGRPWHLLVLSAATGNALEQATGRLSEHLREHPELAAADVAFTLQTGRKALGKRRAVVCHDLRDAAEVLAGGDAQRLLSGAPQSGESPVAFLFPGQGAQYAGMTRELYGVEATFREEIDRCSELLSPALGCDLRSFLYPEQGREEEAAERLRQTDFTQPALFAVEYALARLFMSWGVRPQAMVGHSIGEYVAACLAGVFSLPDALALVAERGRLMAALPAGAMLGVSLAGETLAPRLGAGLALAAFNGPELVTVSGALDEIASLEAELTAEGVRCRRLHTSHAFHSAMMDPILEPFTERLRAVELRPPETRYLSNLTGAWITAEEATDPAYWTRHLRQPVRFSDSLGRLLEEPALILLEVGPGRTLGSLVTLQEQGRGRTVLATVRHPRDPDLDVAFLLRTVARLWLAGVPIDWRGLHAGERRHRVALPAYPFDRRRYWIEPGDGFGAGEGPLPAKRADVGKWFYLPIWKQARPPLAAAAADGVAPPWLLFCDAPGLGRAMATRLRERGHQVTTVATGEAYARISDHEYRIDPRRAEDYRTLLEDLDRSGPRPTTVAHLWSVTAGQEAGGSDLGFYSLLYFGQALERWTEPLRIGVVANGLRKVLDSDELCPEKATLLGPVKVLPQEYPHLTCQSVDVCLPDSEAGVAALAGRVIAELSSAPAAPAVAYRSGSRWVRAYEPVELAGTGGRPRRLRERGVYLITGGLGGLGLTHAEYLAREVAARLVLMGRSAFPARDDWDAWIAEHGADDPVAQKIARLRRLEELGAEVLVVRADVADREQTAAALAAARARFGDVHGVIHAAGRAGEGIVRQKTAEMAAQVLGPKVAGCRVLAELLGGQALDFVVLFSSTTAVAGGFGAIDYCAANAVLDAFAQAGRFAPGTFTVAVDWGTWGEVGMAARAAGALESLHGEHLERAILPAEGLDAFARILGDDLERVVVSPWDLEALIRERSAERSQALLESHGGSAAPTHPRPELATAYVAPGNEQERRLVEIWQDVLGIEPIGVLDHFFELGGNSLSAIQVATRVREVFEVEVPVFSIYDGPTVTALAELLKPEDERDRSALGERLGRAEQRREKRRRRHRPDGEIS